MVGIVVVGVGVAAQQGWVTAIPGFSEAFNFTKKYTCQPDKATVAVGEDVTFSVTEGGIAGSKYWWVDRGGGVIAGSIPNGVGAQTFTVSYDDPGTKSVNVWSCPPGRIAICRRHPPQYPNCSNARSGGAIAATLRQGHLDIDKNSGLLYNPGTAGSDWRRWSYYYAPKTVQQWCGKGDNLYKATEHKAPAPKQKPVSSNTRCFYDKSDGGIGYSSYKLCGVLEGRDRVQTCSVNVTAP